MKNSLFNLSKKFLKILPQNIQDLMINAIFSTAKIYSFIKFPYIFISRLINTNFYQSDLVALGERRSYSFPSKWILIDWKNSDYNINFRNKEKLPLGTNSKKIIYSAHMFEHIGFDAAQFLLFEINRILRPGGNVRIEVPDFNIFLDAYKEDNRPFLDSFVTQHRNLISRYNLVNTRIDEDHIVVINSVSNVIENLREVEGMTKRYVAIPCYAKESVFKNRLKDLSTLDFIKWCVSLQDEEDLKKGGHQCGYNYSIFHDMLKKANFENIKKCEFGKTSINGLSLNEINNKNSIYEKAHRKSMSLYVEAQKVK